MWIAAVLAGVIVVAWGGLTVAAKIPAKHKNLTPQRLKWLLDALLYRGADGAFLLIRVRRGERFIQFRKYIARKGVVGIQSDFPRAPWSEPYFDTLRSRLQTEGIEVEMTPAVGGATSGFLTMDFGRDTGKAASIATMMLQVLQVDPERQCVGEFHGVSPDANARIGF